jgi:NAD-dependent SIR2 family protein deacetylase
MDDAIVIRAAQLIQEAGALVVAAGAGMGVDSGLPDFRGDHGFWRAYPPYQHLGLRFVDLANPRWFRTDPALAWGFYGHRLNLYRATQPHEGFQVLRRWASRLPRGGFVFTSNVDGHFQKAGFDPERVVECHGTIDWMQCLGRCGVGVFPAEVTIEVDETTMRAREPLPRCPGCRGLARPNILMFGDGEWDGRLSDDQEARLVAWLREVGEGLLVVVECGAGLAIPTVRFFSEQLVWDRGASLIRLNPREFQVPRGQFALAVGALAGLRAIDEVLTRAGWCA